MSQDRKSRYDQISDLIIMSAEPYWLARSAYRGSLAKRASRVIPGEDQHSSDDDDDEQMSSEAKSGDIDVSEQ